MMDNQMTFEEWLAGRKEAGGKIDIQICEIARWCVQTLDPYGVEPDLPEELQQFGLDLFVRSPDSGGWVSVHDLSQAKVDALYERIERERQEDPRLVRRRFLVARLHAAGPRPVLEAFIEVAAGRDLDAVLEDFARVRPSIYRVGGADPFSADAIPV